MSEQTPTPGTPEWLEWVAAQKSHPLRDGHTEVTPEQAAEARAAYEAQMAEEATQAQQAAAPKRKPRNPKPRTPANAGKDDPPAHAQARRRSTTPRRKPPS
jgi:hypothetical protein